MEALHMWSELQRHSSHMCKCRDLPADVVTYGGSAHFHLWNHSASEGNKLASSYFNHHEENSMHLKVSDGFEFQSWHGGVSLRIGRREWFWNRELRTLTREDVKGSRSIRKVWTWDMQERRLIRH